MVAIVLKAEHPDMPHLQQPYRSRVGWDHHPPSPISALLTQSFCYFFISLFFDHKEVKWKSDTETWARICYWKYQYMYYLSTKLVVAGSHLWFESYRCFEKNFFEEDLPTFMHMTISGIEALHWIFVSTQLCPRGVLSGKVGMGMCGPDRVPFRPLRFTYGPFFIWKLV